MRKFIYLAVLLFLGVNVTVTVADDSKGKEFWLSFMPNFHNNVESPDPAIKFGDSLYIFINAEQPTTGKITYRDRYGIESVENFSINNTDELYTFKVSYYDYEIWGYNYHGNAFSNFQTEKNAPQSFHIETNEEVTVYAHTQAVTTSDAFIVLPADVLSTEYFIMTYNSDGRTTLNEFSRTPSQFLIVATEDNTTVDITTTVDTYLRPAGDRTINLNKGESYLLQAKFDRGIQNPDLTGSHVVSDKPIAVFGGHQRALVPITNLTGSSRDCIVEHIPPTATWGKNAFIIPPDEPKDPRSTKGSLYRVLACQDSTVININGTQTEILDKGEFYESTLTEPIELISSKPVLVGIFKYTAGESGQQLPIGDPFMMLIPPKEQFISKCKVINVQAWEKNTGDNQYYPVYEEQYIAIVTPETGLDSIYIDDVKIEPSDFTEIQSSGYYYANIPVDDGVHNIAASKQVGVYIYGYGKANSFGYTGGMGLKVINYDPPRFTSIDTCYNISGEVITSDSTTRWLTNVTFLQDSTQNCDVTIGEFSGKHRTDYTAELINFRYDGYTILKAEDNSNRTSLKRLSIPGLTLAYPGHSPNDTLPVIIVNARPSANFSIPINNYGNHTQYITKISLKTDSKGVILQSPDMINSINVDSIYIEYTLDDGDPVSDTVFATTKCGTIAIAVLYINASDCHPSAFEFTEFSDKTLLRLNGKSYLSNGKARLTNSELYQSGTMWYHETVPVLDGFKTDFSFTFSDGHNYDCDDRSKPGADGLAFVIQNAGNAALGFPGGGIGYEGIFNSLAIEFDTYANDNQQIENYFDPNGNHVAIQSMGQDRNTSKHTMNSMLAMNENVMPILADGSIYYVNITYNLKSRTLVVLLDTVENPENEVLRLDDFSIGEYLGLDRGYRAFVGFTAATGCAVETHEVINWSFCPEYPNPATRIENEDEFVQDERIKVIPNPFNSHSEISIDINRDANVKLSIVDILGNEVAVLQEGHLNSGIHLFTWSPSSLDRGMYFIRFTSGTEQVIKKIIYTY